MQLKSAKRLLSAFMPSMLSPEKMRQQECNAFARKITSSTEQFVALARKAASSTYVMNTEERTQWLLKELDERSLPPGISSDEIIAFVETNLMQLLTDEQRANFSRDRRDFHELKTAFENMKPQHAARGFPVSISIQSGSILSYPRPARDF
jgi:hypothetical protein